MLRVTECHIATRVEEVGSSDVWQKLPYAILIVLLPMILQGACHAPVSSSATASSPATSVDVVSHGWHTSVVIKRDHIPDDVWPEHHDFPGATYIEVGWGDAAFYQAPKATSGLALKAIFQATPSVLHIVGLTRPARSYFPESDIIEVQLSQQGFRHLCAFIHETYKRDREGHTLPLGHGPYGRSQFYRANGTYHLFNTCNNWTAKALQAAGCPIVPWQATTAENVMQQASRFGNVTRVKSMAVQQQETFCR